VIGLFNWSEDSSDQVVYDLDKLGLDSRMTYVGFDFWGNQFIEPIESRFQRTVPAASCEILALRVAADHPQLLSTSRHITQGLIDVREETWDPVTRTLRGRSGVVADDSYELRIAVPTTDNWQIGNASIDGSDGEIRIVSELKGSARVVIKTPKNREVAWSISFKEKVPR
jgi:hypothetical protein